METRARETSPRRFLILSFVGSLWWLAGCTPLLQYDHPPAGAEQASKKAAVKAANLPAASPVPASPQAAPPLKPQPSIRVSFKLDERLTRGTYMGARWVSPATYSATQGTVEARAEGLDAAGRELAVNPEWKAADPKMVKISPNQGRQVTITVLRPGKTSVDVAAPRGFKQKLLIKTVAQGGSLRSEISQPAD